MFAKLKAWIIGKVVISKVAGKFAKHATGAILGLLASSQVAPYIAKLGITIDPSTLEGGLTVIGIGLFGSAWNFIEHRLLK